MTEPVRKYWSQEELRVAAMEFMRVGYLPERGNKKAERVYLERVGLVVTFTDWMWDTYAPSQSDAGEKHG